MADQQYSELAAGLRQTKSALHELSAQLKRLAGGAAELQTRAAAACSGGGCSPGAAAGASAVSGATASALSSGLGAALRSALSGEFSRALSGVLSTLTRSLAAAAGRAAGGGIGGSLVSGLLGGGLSLLLGKLFQRRERVQVDNVVRAEVLNFPQLASLDFASNPASRLFGGRAIARGPAFSVEVSYKGGAEDIVTAKVAQKLADLNALQGLAQ